MRKIGQSFSFFIPTIIFAALVVLMAGCERQETEKTDESKAIVRRYWEEVWNKGNLAAVEELYAPNCIQYGEFSIEKYKETVAHTRISFPDLRVTIDELIALEDKVVTRVTYSGTLLGALGGKPPTGKKMTLTGMDMFRIAGGKIVEHWHEADHLAMMKQIGLITE